MATLRRSIFGPDAGTERAEVYRPVRVGAERLGHTLLGQPSGFILGGAAALVAIEPATFAAVVPLALAYAGVVLSRPVTLPLRLPKTANRRDHGYPAPGTRKPQRAAGIIYLGADHVTGQELWITNLDGRQHISVPGVTGSGKTQALLGICVNALAMGSGFVFVDGKADAALPAQVYALARLFGREKDIRNLNFLVASGDQDSNTFNPFAWASADAIREMLLSQIEANPAGASGGDGNRVFGQRAAALLGAWTPILVWLRDHKHVPIDIEAIRFATELESVATIAFQKRHRRLDVQTGAVTMLDVPDVPEALLYPLRAYLGETGGYDAGLPFNKQRSEEPAKQHSFVTMHFSATFTQLAVSLGHIFGRGWSDIDMRDVVLNRRILVVSLPALENSGDTTAALGKLTIAALRGMMAQTLGGKLEGDYAEIIENRPTTAPTPYPIIADELAAYVGAGMDTLLQQGRGLGAMFVLGWHDVAGLRARIGERVWTLLNNATLAVYMRQNVGGENRQHVEQSVGDADVTQTTGFDSDGGGFREARRVDVRRTSRVDWRDLRGLIEGEAVVVHANRRVYARMFHAAIDARGALRLNRPVPLPPPDPDGPRQIATRLAAVRTALETLDPTGAPSDPPPVLRALLAGFRDGLDAGLPDIDAAGAALTAVGAVPEQPEPHRLAAPAEPVPRSDFTPTLEAVAAAPISMADAEQAAIAAVTRQAADILRDIAAIEEACGATPAVARQEAHRALAERDAALEAATLPDPPPMPPEQLQQVLEALVHDVKGVAEGGP